MNSPALTVSQMQTQTVAELTNGIILASFEKTQRSEDSYQSEAQLEAQMIENLVAQGYGNFQGNSTEDLYANLKVQLEKLNGVMFTEDEWRRFLAEYLDAPNDGMIEKTRKIQEDYIHDFTFDDGHLQNIKIIDKKNIHNNFLQVTSQVKQTGTHQNRYDVTVLVNGLPLVHIELKKRGGSLQEAFNQIHRYSKESFNTESSLYKYVQIFVISNGTYTRYFANTTAQDKNHYEFTCEWADAKNQPIRDLQDFTATFFEKRVICELLTKYCVFNAENILLIMRPYQIAATERILWKIKSSYEAKKSGGAGAGGFIWHTTGSGKTLTSFKAARLATELEYIDKVLFIVDRKDLDYQTMKEYQKFQPDSVNGSKDAKKLKENIEKDDNKIVVTTIQKLNEFIKGNKGHEIYGKHCVLIYDECHRSQFGETQKNITKHFKHYYQFGFTGTPIFPENALGTDTTAGTFGAQLHSYVITDAIRDGKVLKFKVDYNNTNPAFREAEQTEIAEIADQVRNDGSATRVPDAEEIAGQAHNDDGVSQSQGVSERTLQELERKTFLHLKRIGAVTDHILKFFNTKTHRNELYTMQDRRQKGFNAMFAVQSIEAAKLYYNEFAIQQDCLQDDKKLRVATIFSFAQNQEQNALGSIPDEVFQFDDMELSDKEFLDQVISDYNAHFQTNFRADGKEFENYYKDLSKRVKNREVDLLIVVGMFLTGFDAPTLNTIFVDKNLKYHGLIQAFSRTNRIFDKVKSFGNIVCFRNLEQATKDAIKLFGDENSVNIILEKSYREYIDGFQDEETGKTTEGYISLCTRMLERFPDSTEIVLDRDKKEFAKLFGEILKLENILKNFDEFESFEHIITERQMQDMKSTYVDIREEMLARQSSSDSKSSEPQIDFSDIEFEVELLKTEEINLDYILRLILEKSRELDDIESLKAEIRRVIRSSLGTRAKEGLIIDFIDQADLFSLKSSLNADEDMLDAFYEYARVQKERQIAELIETEELKDGANQDAKRFIEKSTAKGYVDNAGVELDNLLPPTSRRQGAREAKKQAVLEKIRQFVEVFTGV